MTMTRRAAWTLLPVFLASGCPQTTDVQKAPPTQEKTPKIEEKTTKKEPGPAAAGKVSPGVSPGPSGAPGKDARKIVPVDQGRLVDHELARAANAHNWRKVRALLRRGASVSLLKGRLGLTGLHLAAITGKLTAARVSTASAADLKARASDGATALHFVALSCGAPLVKQLVERGIHPSTRTELSVTPLHLAAMTGNLPVIEYLIGKRARILRTDDHGFNAMHHAAVHGDLKVIALLAGKGGKLDMTYRGQRTLLHTAAQAGHAKLVAHLLERGLGASVRDSQGRTPLHFAAGGWKANVDRLRVQQGRSSCSPGEKCSRDQKLEITAPHFGVEDWKENGAVVRLLVRRGADVKARAQNGRSVLHDAAVGSTHDTVGFLLGKGADARGQDAAGRSVLHVAVGCPQSEKNPRRREYRKAWRRDLRTVKLLVKRGADVRAADKRGRTALHCAAGLALNIEVVRYLLKRGAKPAARMTGTHEQGKLPIHAAIAGGDLKIFGELVRRQGDVNSPIGGVFGMDRGAALLHLSPGNLPMVELLLARKARIDVRDGIGQTPLHVAARKNLLAAVRLLVERGADLKARDALGATVLHAAAKSSSHDARVVAFLLDRKLSANLKTKFGQSVLHAAVDQGSVANVRLLIERGADVDARTAAKEAVLHWAARRNLEIVKLLVARGAKLNPVYSNRTPLDIAEKRGDKKIVKYLKSKGGRPAPPYRPPAGASPGK